MNPSPRLILLNGPAGTGKSTIAERYIADHPLSLAINGDALIAMIGDWVEQEETAREYLLNMMAMMAATYLPYGHDVIVPYLVTDPAQAEMFSVIAQESGARFVETALFTSKAEAVQRLFERGSWGEPNAPPLTPEDQPMVESLYDQMVLSLQSRPQTAIIPCTRGDIEGTYRQFLAVIGA